MAEFRVDERFAPMLFSDSEGRRLGDSVRKVEIETDDPRFKRIGELQAELWQSEGKPFFYGWRLTHKYDRDELEPARLLHVKVVSVFEPAGEVCGTKYDESGACRYCGAGAKQIGALFLDTKRIPKGKDFAKTIAGEIVISRRASDLFTQHGIVGAAFHPVRTKGARSLELSEWSQLIIRSAEAEIVAPTRVGNDPFDDDPKGEYRCPEGHLIGLNLLSEVSISSVSRGDADIVASRQFIGVRRGSLRPERVILVSPKVWRLIDSENLKGCEIEVAHLV
jgi:hypothetical protein